MPARETKGDTDHLGIQGKDGPGWSQWLSVMKTGGALAAVLVESPANQEMFKNFAGYVALSEQHRSAIRYQD